MISRRNFSFATAAAGLAGFPAVHAESDKIVLGQSAAFTGPAAQLGIQFHAGAKLFFDGINSTGGVNGKQVEIRQADDGYEPERCAENTRKFIQDDVFCLFGYIGTPTSLAALPLATKGKVPFVAPFTGAMALRDPFNRYAVHLRASYNDETSLIVRQLHNGGMKKVAVCHQNDAYGKAGLDGTTLALSALNLKPHAVATVERNSVDVAKAVEAIVSTMPDAIVQIGAYKGCAAFIRAARKAGFNGVFANVSFVGTQALADELGSEGKGVMITQVMPYPYSPVHAITREFADHIHKGGNKVQANYSSMEGYVAAKLLTEGLKRAVSKGGRESLVGALEAVGNQSFGGFQVSLSSTDHVASHFVEMSMLVGDGRVRV